MLHSCSRTVQHPQTKQTGYDSTLYVVRLHYVMCCVLIDFSTLCVVRLHYIMCCVLTDYSTLCVVRFRHIMCCVLIDYRTMSEPCYTHVPVLLNILRLNNQEITVHYVMCVLRFQ